MLNRAGWKKWITWRSIGTVIVFAVLFMFLQQLTFLLRSPPFERTTLWAPGALTFAALLVVPRSRWWEILLGLWIGSFTAYYDDREFSGFATLLAAPVHFIIVAAGVRWMQMFSPRTPFSNVAGMVAFMTVAGVMIPAGTAFPLEFLNAFVRSPLSWLTALRSFLCVSLGVTVASPAFYSLGRLCSFGLPAIPLTRTIEAIVLGTGLLVINAFVFTASPNSNAIPALVYAPIPFLVWSALRFEAVGVSWALLSVGYISTWNAINGRGPFVTPSGDDHILQLQLFLLAVAIPLFLTAAATTERRTAYNLLLTETEERRRVEERFRTVVESIPAVVLVLNQEGQISLVNQNVLRLLGYDIRCDQSTNLSELFTTTEYREIEPIVSGGLSDHHKGSPCTLEARALKSDGTELPVEITFVCLGEGQHDRILAIILDQSDRKKAEESRKELLHASRLVQLSEFTTSIAHEINQPLAAIMSNAETAKLLLDRETPPLEELRGLVTEICNDDRRASEVIKRLRSLIRKSVPRKCLVDMNLLLNETQRLMGFESKRRGIDIQVTVPPQTSHVFADPVHLQQVLMNLLANAIDAAEQGRAEPEVDLMLVRTGDSVVLTVSDTGPGLGPGGSEKVFTRFYTTKPNGLGLGLAITRSLVEEYNGSITSTVDPRGRTTFVVTLPVAQAVPIPASN